MPTAHLIYARSHTPGGLWIRQHDNVAPRVWSHTGVLVGELDIPCPDDAAGEAWLLGQIGKPYDLLDILSFLVWRDIGRPGRYVCSGQIVQALLAPPQPSETTV